MTEQVKKKTANLEDVQAFGRVIHNKGIGSEGTCTTAADTAAKEVTVGTTFSPVAGATILVTFQNAVSAASATLAVTYGPSGSQQTLAAKPIRYRGAALPAGLVRAGSTHLLRYDGTSFNILGDLDTDAIPSTEKGANGGVATLGNDGKIPSSQLPGYVDDVIDLLDMAATAPAGCAEGDKYYNTSSKKIFTATASNTWGGTGSDPEGGKIYVNLTNEKCYRWSGSAMIEISSSDVIGIKVGPSGTTITPSQGVIELPAYETGAQVNPSAATPSTSGTGGTDGLMTAQDKEKLNGIQAGAQVNPSVMGASGSTHASGLVPDTPTTAGTSKYLREDGTWAEPSYAYSEIGYTVNAITSAGGTVSLDGTTPLHVVTLTGNVSALTLSANPPAGHSCHVILASAAERTVAISHDATNRVCPDGEDPDPLIVPAGGYVEVDFLAANNLVYVRGV